MDVDRALHFLEGEHVFKVGDARATAQQKSQSTSRVVTITLDRSSNISITRSAAVAAHGHPDFVMLASVKPLDSIAVSKILHIIGCKLSRSFASSQDVFRSLGRRSQVQFADLVEILKEDDINLCTLTPDHISQVCKKAGGDDQGEVDLDIVAKLMDEYDWRRDLQCQLADAVFERRLDIDELYRSREQRLIVFGHELKTNNASLSLLVLWVLTLSLMSFYKSRVNEVLALLFRVSQLQSNKFVWSLR